MEDTSHVLTPAAPGHRIHYNVHPLIQAKNNKDAEGSPSGGSVLLTLVGEAGTYPGLVINWQDGPRGQATNPDGSPTLEDPNGAFVEDVIWAALQRLEYFQDSKYRCRENALAITKLEEALFILKDRQLSRSWRGVEGKHEV